MVENGGKIYLPETSYFSSLVLFCLIKHILILFSLSNTVTVKVGPQ